MKGEREKWLSRRCKMSWPRNPKRADKSVASYWWFGLVAKERFPLPTKARGSDPCLKTGISGGIESVETAKWGGQTNSVAGFLSPLKKKERSTRWAPQRAWLPRRISKVSLCWRRNSKVMSSGNPLMSPPSFPSCHRQFQSSPTGPKLGDPLTRCSESPVEGTRWLLLFLRADLELHPTPLLQPLSLSRSRSPSLSLPLHAKRPASCNHRPRQQEGPQQY